MKISKQVKTTIGALIVTSLLMSSAVFAHPGFGPGRLGMMKAPLLEELQLTGDQKARVETIFAAGRETIQPLYQQLREKQTALREAARTEPFDEALVRSQAQELANLQAQMMVARAQLMNQVLSILTDEQKARLKELRDQRLQRFMEWRKQHLGKTDQRQN